MAVVVLAAAAVFGYLFHRNWDITLRLAQILLVLAILYLICHSTPATVTSRQSAWSPSSSAALAAVVLLGPGSAAAVGGMSLFSLRRGGLRERAFNGR